MGSDPQSHLEQQRHAEVMALQGRVERWVRSRIGPEAMASRERAMRLLEEATELAQAEGIPFGDAVRQMAYVYNRPPGIPKQEAGGVAVCLFGWCASRRVSLLSVAEDEVDRIERKPITEIRGSLARKQDQDLLTYTRRGEVSESPELPYRVYSGSEKYDLGPKRVSARCQSQTQAEALIKSMWPTTGYWEVEVEVTHGR